MKLNEDDLLGDIMAELHQDGAASGTPAPVKLKKKTPARYVYTLKPRLLLCACVAFANRFYTVVV